MEKFENTGSDWNPELLARINAEFEEYAKERLKGGRVDYEKLVGLGIVTREKADENLERTSQELSTTGFEGKIAKTLNNFHCWWPNGIYCSSLMEEIASEDPKGAETRKTLIADLESSIHEHGYDDLSNKISNREELPPDVRLKVLSEIYFAMKDKGYKRSDLVT